MAQVSIVSGIYASGADYRQSYPINYYPAVMSTGISKAYLRPAPGLVEFSTATGVDRGGIEFRGELYRISGSRLIKISPNAVITDLGYIPGIGRVSLAGGFDRFCIVTAGRGFYYLPETGLVEITDPNFALALDVVFIDGYFMFTDGDFLFPAELSDPLVFDPIKFGSAEIDSDPIQSLEVVRNELHAVGSTTVEIYQNVGGSNFPFARVKGAVITKGSVARYASLEVEDALFFVGSGRGEAPSVYMGSAGRSQRISTDEIDKTLQSYSPQQLATITIDSYSSEGSYFVLINLPDQTLGFDVWSSATAGMPLWHIRTAAGEISAPWRCSQPVRVYGKWIGGDPTAGRLCEIRSESATEYGEILFREFATPLSFLDGNGFLVHKMQIYGIPAATLLTVSPQIAISISRNGVEYGVERWVNSGKRGRHDFAPVWRKIGRADKTMTARFRVVNESLFTPARLEASIEVLRD
jgi:hypothetical protein